MGHSLVRVQSAYRLPRGVRGQSQDSYSGEGDLELHLEPGSLPGGAAYVVVMTPGAVPGPVPAGLVLGGDPYAVTASGAMVALEKPGVLKLHYDGALVGQVLEGLSIYRWDPNSERWQAMPGSLDAGQKAVVATVTTLGTYALLAPEGPWTEPLPNTVFLPIILK